ncbi:MAG: hypothetical protein JWQ21_3560, partial [Herminiimonas sp.]|nr:hypothetical protein [Herminiimonas sp.]
RSSRCTLLLNFTLIQPAFPSNFDPSPSCRKHFRTTLSLRANGSPRSEKGGSKHGAIQQVPINPHDDSHEVMMNKALLTKSEQWSYESEWRLCRYDGGPGVVQFRPANLTGIIIGALASPSTADTVMTWVRQRSVPVNLYRASVSPKNFELHIAPIRAASQPTRLPQSHE